MRIIADLHIHSRFSRATSSELNIPNLVKYAKMKGVSLLGTGDFTHPSWLRELKGELQDDDEGILRTREGFPFMLSAEIASIYSQDHALKRIHNIVLCPDFETAEQVIEALRQRKVNVESDGRPITGIRSPELVEMLMGINPMMEIIPAHIWTPWFSLFGSRSGFDRVEDCFQDQTKNIHALETGLSSDPAMNWRLSQLDKFALVSFSDSHSFWPWRMGREATIFEAKEPSYENIVKALRSGEGLEGTIEVDPSYGKYHYDGHRDCGISLKPEDSRKLHDICPACKRPLTIGVLHRVEELADRPEGYRHENSKPFNSLIPLSEIIASAMKATVSSGKVWDEYNKIISSCGSELEALLNASHEALKAATHEKIAGMIIGARSGRIKIRPGYDGVYGEIESDGSVGKRGKRRFEEKPQKTLGDF
jgi:uncharacterized protein (TIGR00375 family)